MPSPLKIENIKGNWTIPVMGVLGNFPITKLPPEALYRGSNVVWRRGYLRCRPGMKTFGGSILTGVVTGGYAVENLGSAAFQADTFQNDTFQVSVPASSSLLFAGTTRKLYLYQGGVSSDVTGTTLTANPANFSRFTSIFYGGTLYVLMTNGIDPAQVWTGGAAFANLAGSPPAFIDWCNIGQHIIGIVGTYGLRWSNLEDVNGAGSWPGANFMNASETPDAKVAIRNLGTQGGVLYGKHSIYNVIAQGGAEATFFRRELKYLVDGPVSPQAVVDADGAHYYMCHNGKIGRFDGSTHMWVADGIWPVIFQQDDTGGNDIFPGMDTANSQFTFGVYEPRYKEVWFFYPRVGENAICQGVAVVVLPRPQDGITQHICFHGTLGVGVTAGADLRFGEFKSVLWTSVSPLSSGPQAFTWEEGFNDNGVPIPGVIQTGLVGGDQAGDELFNLEAFEILCQRGAGFGSIQVAPVTSYILDTEGGTVNPPKSIDLNQTTVFDKQGVGVQGSDVGGRYFGLQVTFSGPIKLRWQGARLSAAISGPKDLMRRFHA